MTLGDLRNMLLMFEGAPDDVTLVTVDPDTGCYVDLGVGASVCWRDEENKATHANNTAEKVFRIQFVW